MPSLKDSKPSLVNLTFRTTMELKDLKTFTDKLCDKDIAMIHYCLRKESFRLSDFQESLESDFKPHEVPTRTFRDNVHNRTELLLVEVKQELQYLSNLIHYCEEFFNYPEDTEYHCFKSEPEKGTNHINNML